MSDSARPEIDAEVANTGRLRRGIYVMVLLVMLFHLNDFAGDMMALSSMTLTLSIVEQGTVTIDEYVHPDLELSWHDGRFYSGMPPGQSFVALPLYALTRPVLMPLSEVLYPRLAHLQHDRGTRFVGPYAVRRVLLLALFQVLVTVPIAAATPVMVFDISRRMLGDHLRLVSLALLMGVGSLWWAYGAGPGPRTMGGTAVLLPLWWLLCRRDRLTGLRAGWEAAGCGTALAVAFSLRYDAVLVAVPIVVFFLLRARRREAALLVAGGALGVGLVLTYHAHCFGSPLTTPYARKLTPISDVRHQWHEPTDDLPKVIVDGEEFALYRQARVLMRPENIATGLLTTGQSLLWFTPALLLSMVGAWMLAGRGRIDRGLVLTVIAAAATGPVLLVMMPHPGFRGAIGPRYILPSLPYWFLLLAPAWIALPRAAHLLLFAASFVPSYLAAMFTTRLGAAWDPAPLREFGLSTYILSRLNEAGMGVTPIISTAICLALWALLVLVALRLPDSASETERLRVQSRGAC